MTQIQGIPAIRSKPATPAERAGRDPAEAALLVRLRAGEDAAFAQWVSAETPRLLAAVRRIVRSEEDARDAVQDAFLQAFRALPRFAGDSRLSTWLHRIAINAALMQLRRRRTRPEQSLDDLLPKFREDGHREDPGHAWPPLDPDSIDRSELREILQQCFDRLPESQRLVALLRDAEGLDTAEVSALLGISADAVKMRLHRARQALRTMLEPYVQAGLRPAARRE